MQRKRTQSNRTHRTRSHGGMRLCMREHAACVQVVDQRTLPARSPRGQRRRSVCQSALCQALGCTSARQRGRCGRRTLPQVLSTQRESMKSMSVVCVEGRRFECAGVQRRRTLGLRERTPKEHGHWAAQRDGTPVHKRGGARSLTRVSAVSRGSTHSAGFRAREARGRARAEGSAHLGQRVLCLLQLCEFPPWDLNRSSVVITLGKPSST